MANLDGFNANHVDPASEFDPVPEGRYTAVVTGSEMKPTKAGNGVYLELTFQIIEGEFKNRMLWARLNLENPSETAVKIARAELSALCRAIGVLEPKDSCELHDLPLVVTVRRKHDANGTVRNEIKGYSKRESSGARPAQSSSKPPPWSRG